MGFRNGYRSRQADGFKYGFRSRDGSTLRGGFRVGPEGWRTDASGYKV